MRQHTRSAEHPNDERSNKRLDRIIRVILFDEDTYALHNSAFDYDGSRDTGVLSLLLLCFAEQSRELKVV